MNNVKRTSRLRTLRNPRLLAGVAIVAVLLAVALRPQPIEVDVATVTRGPIQVTIDEEGETRVRQRYVVSTPVAGRVLRIDLEPGDTVEQGSTVATIQPAPPAPLDARDRAEALGRVQAAEAAAGRTRAEVQRARAARDFAVAEAARARNLAGAGAISTQELESRESAVRITQQELAAAEFAVRTADEELRVARARLTPGGTTAAAGPPVVVRAPVTGTVLRRMRESEAVVAPGEPLIELGDPNDLEVVSDLLSTDAVRVRRGHPVRIEQWGGDTLITGTVRRVEPAGFTKISALGVEEQRVNVIIDFQEPTEAWHTLGDSYRVEVRVVIAERDDVLKVPTSSLFRRADGFAVFVYDHGRARLQPVDIGLRNSLEAEVAAGLAEGETIVVHPPDTIADGAPLALRNAAVR